MAERRPPGSGGIDYDNIPGVIRQEESVPVTPPDLDDGEIMHCTYKDYGCKQKLKRKDMPGHSVYCYYRICKHSPPTLQMRNTEEKKVFPLPVTALIGGKAVSDVRGNLIREFDEAECIKENHRR